MGEEEEPSIRIEELSVLEKAEQELERRKRKRIPGDEFEDKVKKRKRRNKRRNIINRSSSSEDETEKLREQIKEESILLAHFKRGTS